MAADNDVIDLRGADAIEDVYVSGMRLDVNGYLILEMNDGSEIGPLDLGPAFGFAEKGGVVWVNTQTYVAGDVVTEGTNSYVAIAASDSGDPKQPSLNAGTWAPMGGVVAERGGLNFNPANSYQVGDVVTYTADAYICLVAGSYPWDDANWKSVLSEERGGTTWTNTVYYQEGDIVSDDNIVYIALANTLNESPTLLINWAVVSTAGLAYVYIKYDIIAYAGQTIFPGAHKAETLQVFSDGVKVRPTEYTADEVNVIFTNPVDFDTWIEISSMMPQP